MTSVIILPAHNESNVIEATLTSIINSTTNDTDIIVVANGCTDNTVEIANRFEARVKVIETTVPSKTNALNIGEASTTFFPRIYMDADIQLTQGSVSKIVDALLIGDKLAVSPTPKMDLSKSNWAVKAYYDIWLSLPYCKNGMLGSGVFALSEEGRKRFNKFPDVIADDGYVRALFNENERGMVKEAIAIVRAPESLYWLLKIKTRSRLGQMELAQKYPELLKNEEKDYTSALREIIKYPSKWPKLAIYIFVALVSRLLAKRKLRSLSSYQWQKDMSSRK